MALGSLALPGGNIGFDAEGTAMVPISAGESKLGEIKIKSPLDTFKETFSEMKESLSAMVGIQTAEAKRQAFHDQQSLKQRSFENEQANQRLEDAGMQGPVLPTLNDDLEGVDTDKKENVEAFESSLLGAVLGDLKDAFDNVSFGEKMTALLLTGGFALFSKYSDQITKALTPVVQFVMDIVDTLGPEGAFGLFIGGFILLKSGLASKLIKGAGGLILKTIKASAASLDRQGGLFKAMGNGFEAINKGAKSLVGQVGKMGTMITGGLTKGFNALGAGLKSLRLGIVSMSGSLSSMLIPFLPVLAIAAAAVAIFFSLKSGFETFKQSLDEGDSMFTAVLKGLGDAMLTLVTLPATLVKKLVGFIAGLFGFDNFKAELESFSIKDKIVQVFKSLTGGMVNIIKAIAKGAAAALAAAIPGGKTPQEEFARVYAEVMKGGEGESAALQGTSDFQGDQSQADFNKDNNEKVKGYNNMGEYLDIDEGVGTGNATAMSFYKKQIEDQRYRDLGTGPFTSKDVRMGETGIDDEYDDFSKEMGMVPVQSKEFEAKLERKTVMKEGKIVSDESKIIYIKGGDKQGDTITNASTTQVTGELSVNHNEMTQKILSEHF